MSTLSVNNVTEVGGAPVVTGGVLDSGSLPTGTVLQVVSTAKTDTFSTTSTSFVDITGLSASITPSSTDNKILVLFNGMIGSSAGGPITGFRLLRDATVVGNGDSAGSRSSGFTAYRLDTVYNSATASVGFLDSPSTTSSVTYKIQIKTSSGTAYMNRASSDADVFDYLRGISSITLLEVAG